MRMVRLGRKTLRLPLPPPEMRALIGIPEEAGWDHPRGRAVFPPLTEPPVFRSVLDFGCGCGRVARQLAQADKPMPGHYLGIDLHAGMIGWCNENLAPRLRGFEFRHHDVYNPGLNPNPDLPRMLPFPVAEGSVSLLIAVSVFTHLTQDSLEFYLDEVARVLAPDGVVAVSFFLFEKRYFPMMQDFQNALYINPGDPTNAVIVDREWLLAELTARGLGVVAATPPEIRGFQWTFHLRHAERSIEIPPDRAPFGHRAPPVPTRPAHEVGT